MCRYREIRNVDERIRDVFYTKERCCWIKMPGSRLTNRGQAGKKHQFIHLKTQFEKIIRGILFDRGPG